MRGKASKIEKSWYMLGLPKLYYLAVWIFIGIALAVSVFEMIREAYTMESASLRNQVISKSILYSICIILASAAIIIQRTRIQPGFRKYFSLSVAVFVVIVSIITAMRILKTFIIRSLIYLTFVNVRNIKAAMMDIYTALI